MNRIFLIGLVSIALSSCSGSKEDVSVSAPEQQVAWDAVDQVFYNEFIPCTAGNDFNQESVDAMVADWRMSGLSSNLLGAWGYAPASDNNQFPNGWWEVSWTSRADADDAWAQWSKMESAQAWSAKHENVMVCDAEGRFGWDFKFHRAPDSFGPTPKSGEFASAFTACSFNEGKGFDDLDASIVAYNSWLDGLDPETVNFYAFGIYSARSETETNGVDYFWGNFHETFETMKAGNEEFEATGAAVRAAFEATATCRDADVYNSKVFYDPSNPDFS